MKDRATEFLEAWTLAREPSPVSRGDAVALAAQWESDAEENAVAVADLRAAAGGDLADYIVRTFGEPRGNA